MIFGSKPKNYKNIEAQKKARYSYKKCVYRFLWSFTIWFLLHFLMLWTQLYEKGRMKGALAILLDFVQCFAFEAL